VTGLSIRRLQIPGWVSKRAVVLSASISTKQEFVADPRVIRQLVTTNFECVIFHHSLL